ncbi:extracellular solute-binding protein [Microbacterium aquimaris]|uniref:ABC transporter substrate-binding protein n=1 Tax=Microbacterium aquimaris TaxID=459816 RepID=UPI002AD31AB8|nr:extracellular solute-binding protein [Microbacterium aquimaris]MDZ8275741.1 extracellular solute-binding protein [Microbacterium aquimaris]
MMFQSQAKFAASLGVTTVAVLALSGCGAAGSSGSTDTNADIDPSEVSGDIRFATWWAYVDDDLIAGFNEKYPLVNVELEFTAVDSYRTKLQADAAANDLPDVFSIQEEITTALGNGGRLYDLGPALDTASYDIADTTWRETFNPALLAQADAAATEKPDGQQLGVPFNAITFASIYNEDIFDEVGVAPPETFEELLSNCTVLRDAGYIPMSLTGQTWIELWPRLAWDQTMRDLSADDFTVEQPEYIAGFQAVADMADARCWDDSQIATDIAEETSLFLQEKTAQFVSVPENFLGTVADGAEFPIATYPLPAIGGDLPARALGGGSGNVIAVSPDSENSAAAIAFSKYLTSEAVQTELANSVYTMPSIEIELEASSPLMAAYVDAAEQGFADPGAYLPPQTTAGRTKLLGEIIPQLILGQISAEQAAADSVGVFEN